MVIIFMSTRNKIRNQLHQEKKSKVVEDSMWNNILRDNQIWWQVQITFMLYFFRLLTSRLHMLERILNELHPTRSSIEALPERVVRSLNSAPFSVSSFFMHHTREGINSFLCVKLWVLSRFYFSCLLNSVIKVHLVLAGLVFLQSCCTILTLAKIVMLLCK